MLRCALSALLATATVTATAHAQRVDTSGPFVSLGGVLGSVTRSAAAPGASHTGYGWSAAAGVSVSKWTSVVANYAIYNFQDDGAPETGAMEQAEFGLRFHVGGGTTPAVFYVEGGGAHRRADMTTGQLFPTSPPADAGATVDTQGWAGWFGPGVQLYFGRRLAGEINVAWAWGTMDRVHLGGTTVDAESGVGLTTLRLRAGISATLF